VFVQLYKLLPPYKGKVSPVVNWLSLLISVRGSSDKSAPVLTLDNNCLKRYSGGTDPDSPAKFGLIGNVSNSFLQEVKSKMIPQNKVIMLLIFMIYIFLVF